MESSDGDVHEKLADILRPIVEARGGGSSMENVLLLIAIRLDTMGKAFFDFYQAAQEGITDFGPQYDTAVGALYDTVPMQAGRVPRCGRHGTQSRRSGNCFTTLGTTQT